MCILGSVLLFLAEIVEIDVAEVGKIWSLRPNYLLSNSVVYIYCISAFCWPTGDNVRLSDVVKLTSRNRHPKQQNLLFVPTYLPHSYVSYIFAYLYMLAHGG